MSAERLVTVAEIVASLPPVSKLLGCEEAASDKLRCSNGRRPYQERTHRTQQSAGQGQPLSAAQAGRTTSSRGPVMALQTSLAAPREGAAAAARAAARRAVHEDRDAWRRIRNSLTVPLVSRLHDDIQLTLSHLRRISFFAELSEADLLTVVGEMELLDTRGKNVEVARVMACRRSAREDDDLGGHRGTDRAALSPFGSSRNKEHTFTRPCDGAVDGTGKSRQLVSFLGQAGGPSFPAVMAGSPAPSGRQRARAPRSERAADAALRQIESLHRSMGEALQKLSAGDTGTDVNGAASFENGDGAASDEDDDWLDAAILDPVMVVLDGKVLLELPTANGKEHFPLVDGDVFGYNMLTAALPVGARYVTAEPCVLLRIWQKTNANRRALHVSIRAVLDRAEDLVFKQQLHFLTNVVTPKLFDVAAQRQTSVPTDPQLALCARGLVPLRVLDNQLLAIEGEASDAAFFIREGSVVVSRAVPLKGTAQRSVADGREGRVVVMEVAMLHRGEFCGELGLLGYNPDVRPGEGVVWTADYWRDALENRFRTPPAALDGTGAIRPKGVPRSSGGGPPAGSAEGGAEEDRALEKRALFAEKPAPRMTTLSSRNASLVYRLDYAVCRDAFSRAVVSRLREFAKGYPSLEDLRDRYRQQRDWDVYRKGVYEEALSRARRK